MQQDSSNASTCAICHQQKDIGSLYPIELVRPALLKYIKSKKPGIDPAGYICMTDLNLYRTKYMEHVMKTGKKETRKLENEVIASLSEHETLSKNINTEFIKDLTYGEKLADKIATFGGSWKFIIFFVVTLAIWIAINTIVLLKKPFDPYPFILLNLILSCIAAIQAPVIMMSQNRQEAKDRLRAEHDYKVNLKAELEIRHLNEKIDYLLVKQWQRLLEIQQFQTEIMEEILNTKEHK